MPKFVVLRHEVPMESNRSSHWDFMLEHNGELWTWELLELPSPTSDLHSISLTARRLPNHRIAYLEYEGAVSGNRGSVTRTDHGDYFVRTAGIKSSNGDSTSAVSTSNEPPSRFEIELVGNRMRGTWRLERTDHLSDGWTFSLVSASFSSFD